MYSCYFSNAAFCKSLNSVVNAKLPIPPKIASAYTSLRKCMALQSAY